MVDFKGKDFLGNLIKNGDFAVISRYSRLSSVVVIQAGEKSDFARFVFVNNSNKKLAETGERLAGGVLLSSSFIKADVNSLGKEVIEQFEVIKRRIKTID